MIYIMLYNFVKFSLVRFCGIAVLMKEVLSEHIKAHMSKSIKYRQLHKYKAVVFRVYDERLQTFRRF